MILVSTWFMDSSTDFCSWPVILMLCSVLPKDYLRLMSCAATFSYSALSYPCIMSRVAFIFEIMVDCAPSF